MNQHLERQKLGEEKARSRQFRVHPNYGWGLQYRILPEGNVYKVQSYNLKLKTYRLKNIPLDNQNLTVHYQLITTDRNNERDTYTFGLEQNFLHETEERKSAEQNQFLTKKLNELGGVQN